MQRRGRRHDLRLLRAADRDVPETRPARAEAPRCNFAAGTATVKGHSARDELFAAGQPGSATSRGRWIRWRNAGCWSSGKRSGWRWPRRKLWQAALLTVPVMVSGMLMHRSPLLRLIEFALSTAIMFGPGGDIFSKAWMLATAARRQHGYADRRRAPAPPSSTACPACCGRIITSISSRPPASSPSCSPAATWRRKRQGPRLRGDPQADRIAAGDGAAPARRRRGGSRGR